MTDQPIAEPYVVQDIFASGFLQIEEAASGITRTVFFAHQRSIHDGSTERVIVARLVMPQAVLRDFAMAILRNANASLDHETRESIAAVCGTGRPQ